MTEATISLPHVLTAWWPADVPFWLCLVSGWLWLSHHGDSSSEEDDALSPNQEKHTG